MPAQVAELTSKVDELSATRKALASDNLKEKHYQVGSVILGLGTSFAIEGPVNTFLRAEKLFPGPHLYAGAGVVVCWAMAASMVPLMSKGKDSARYAHMAFNVLALGFFTWQVNPPRSPDRPGATPRHARPAPFPPSPTSVPAGCCSSPQVWRLRSRWSRRPSSPELCSKCRRCSRCSRCSRGRAPTTTAVPRRVSTATQGAHSVGRNTIHHRSLYGARRTCRQIYI